MLCFSHFRSYSLGCRSSRKIRFRWLFFFSSGSSERLIIVVAHRRRTSWTGNTVFIHSRDRIYEYSIELKQDDEREKNILQYRQ